MRNQFFDVVAEQEERGLGRNIKHAGHPLE